MAVVVIDTIKPKNNGTFPVVEAADVAVTGSQRLPAALNAKANQSDVATLSATVANKADKSALDETNTAVAGKQAALTEEQLAACNSGITSALVTQIGTNTTAIAGKASQSALDSTNAAVATKANASDVATETENLQAQIDNIVSGSTEDSEVINARVGANGTSYSTLKQRIDTEVTALSHDIDCVSNEVNNGNYLIKKPGEIPFENTTDNRIKTSTIELNVGEIVKVTDADYKIALCVTGTINVSDWADTITITSTRKTVAFKKADNSNISTMTSSQVSEKIYAVNVSDVKTQLESVKTDVNNAHVGADSTSYPSLKARLDAEYAKVNQSISDVNADSIKNIDNLSSALNNGKYVVKALGEIPFQNTADTRIKTSSIELNVGDTVYLTDSDYRIALCVTGTTNTTSWTDEPITITATRRSVAFKKADNADISAMTSNAVSKKIYAANKSNIQKQLDKLNVYANGGKFAHISFDDVRFCLEDITINAETYTSIFNNPFFEKLKELHDMYGSVFSLYVFTENLSNYTDVFKAEFSANADWLKFGFHALNATTNLENTTAEQASGYYNAFAEQIMRITGNVECIDRCPRLGNFKGNLDSMLALRNCNGGISGALSAYDTRDSYYLNSANSAYVKKNGKLYDATNYLTFFRTIMTMEVEAPSTSLPKLLTLDEYNNSKYLIAMMHEYEIYTENYALVSGMVSRVEYACEFAQANNYSWDFPMNRL